LGEDQQLTAELTAWMMSGNLVQTTPAHILAASPTIRKGLAEKLHVKQVGIGSLEEAPEEPSKDPLASKDPLVVLGVTTRTSKYSLPLCKVDVLINGIKSEAGILDQGSQIIIIRRDLAREVGTSYDPLH